MKKLCLITLAVFVVLAFSGCAAFAADDYPSKPIRHIAPFPPGGAGTTAFRLMLPYFEKELGTNIVIENIEGAGTQIGLTALAASPGDGYTIGHANMPQLSFTIAVQNASYKMSDFVWLNMHILDVLGVSVLPDKPWKNFQDFIDDIKANPGKISIGVNQMTSPHLFALQLQQEYGLDFIIVPYGGSGETSAALMGGHVDAAFTGSYSVYPMRDSIRVIAVGDAERSPLWPDTPTILEATGDEKLSEMAFVAVAARGMLVPRALKDDYPERFQILLDAYNRAFHSEGHMADAKKVGQDAVMRWTGPEEAQRIAEGMAKVVDDFAHLFTAETD